MKYYNQQELGKRIRHGKALEFQQEGHIKIKSHAKVRKGDLFYDSREAVR